MNTLAMGRAVAALSLCTIVSCAQGPPASQVTRRIVAVHASASVGGEPLRKRGAVERFYKARASRPAWLGHANEIVTAIRGMQADGLDPADYHLQAIESLL